MKRERGCPGRGHLPCLGPERSRIAGKRSDDTRPALLRDPVDSALRRSGFKPWGDTGAALSCPFPAAAREGEERDHSPQAAAQPATGSLQHQTRQGLTQLDLK